jgi:hypothetical protein
MSKAKRKEYQFQCFVHVKAESLVEAVRILAKRVKPASVSVESLLSCEVGETGAQFTEAELRAIQEEIEEATA